MSIRVFFVEVTLRRCVKYRAMIVFMAGLLLAAFAGQSMAAVNAVVDSTWNSWPNTVYYVAKLSGPNAPYTDLKVYITAVDQYKLWINGNRIDTADKNDGKWETVEEYAVAGGAEVQIAVEVTNLGLGNGNGLMVDIDAGPDWLGTTTMQRRSQYSNGSMRLFPVTWYYYSGDITAAVKKADWYKFDSSFFTNAVNLGFKPVLLGNMGRTDYTPDVNIEVVAGYANNLDVGSDSSGGMRLRRIDGENIALGKPGEYAGLMDGDLTQGFLWASDPMGTSRKVDLERTYKVNRMVLYTGSSKPDEWIRNSLRGYGVEISLDDNRYAEVGLIQEIGVLNVDRGGYDWSEVIFPAQATRYIQFKVNAKRDYMPHVGEMMVFGTGYAYGGTYESPWMDLGSANLKNIQRVTWEGDVPGGTGITVRTRTRRSATDAMSPWSQAHTDKSFEFDSPEPVGQVQYQVALHTNDPDKTPVFRSLTFSFSKDDQPLLSGMGSIVPNEVPMGVDTSFVYTLSYKLNTGQNLQTVAVSVPNYARVDSLELNGTVLTAPADFTSSSTNDSLYVTLNTPATAGTGAEDRLLIYFHTKLLMNQHAFSSGIFNATMNDGAGPMVVWENVDMPWSVTTTDIIEEMLTNVNAVPKVMTPNKDGRNDFSVIEFELVKAQSQVEISIFSTDGTLVRELYDDVLVPRDYTGDNDPGRWDGTDDDGDLVAPGIYVYQVVVKSDSGDKVKTGTVVVAY